MPPPTGHAGQRECLLGFGLRRSDLELSDEDLGKVFEQNGALYRIVLHAKGTGSVATVAGGSLNAASGLIATVGGGYYNGAFGYAATVPGGYGNVVIGGHRTSHTRPFYFLDLLKVGDEIIYTTEAGRFVYVITGTFIVAPEAFAAPSRVATYEATVRHEAVAERSVYGL